MTRNGPPPRVRFPPNPGCQPRLSPCAGFAPGDVDGVNGSSCYLEQARSQGIKVVENDPVLDTNVAVVYLVEADSEMSENRSCVHALVDSHERHPYARQIIRCKRPEASV